MVANMNAWPSVQERLAGKAPIATREFIWNDVDFLAEDTAAINTRAAIYGLIKEYQIKIDDDVSVMEFADAIDC